MKKVLASFRKEVILLLRDPAGLGILFILPGVMVFLITLIQNSAFSQINEKQIHLVYVDEDADSLGAKIYKGLYSGGMFDMDTSVRSFTEAESAVLSGKYQMMIHVRKNATRGIRDKVDNMLAASIGSSFTTADSTTEVTPVKIIFDPAIQASYKAVVVNALEKNISLIQSEILVTAFSDRMSALIPGMKPLDMSIMNTNGVEESYAGNPETIQTPNAVQHNVPAWTVFAMFFIVIPLATNLVREKDNGIAMRLRTLPGSFFSSLAGKMLAYLIVCMVQFALMMSVGLFFLPLLGLPVLEIGRHPEALLIIALSCGLAGTSYGILVGTLAKTHDQAASFGSISVIIMAALGGIWVPSFVMPDPVKVLGSISPLNWALEAFYGVFLRGADVIGVLPQILILLLFSISLFGISFFIQSRRST